MISTMKAIDFNTWMTLIAMSRNCKIANDAYIDVPDSNVLPEFPRDLSRFAKPSIIVQKVGNDVTRTCFGNGFIGQTWDDVNSAYVDVFSRKHDMTFQFDAYGDT